MAGGREPRGPVGEDSPTCPSVCLGASRPRPHRISSRAVADKLNSVVRESEAAKGDFVVPMPVGTRHAMNPATLQPLHVRETKPRNAELEIMLDTIPGYYNYLRSVHLEKNRVANSGTY